MSNIPIVFITLIYSGIINDFWAKPQAVLIPAAGHTHTTLELYPIFPNLAQRSNTVNTRDIKK